MPNLTLPPDTRVLLKLCYTTDQYLVSIMGADSLGIWIDPYDLQALLRSVPINGIAEPYEQEGDGNRGTMFIPFAHIHYMVKLRD